MQTISSGVDGTALRMSDMSLAPGADIGKSLSSIETGAGLLSEAPAQSAYTTGTSYALKDPAAVNAVQSNFAPGASSEMANAASCSERRKGAGDTGSGAFGNFGQWMSQNKELVKAGSGMLSGLGQGLHGAGEDEGDGAPARAGSHQDQRQHHGPARPLLKGRPMSDFKLPRELPVEDDHPAESAEAIRGRSARRAAVHVR